MRYVVLVADGMGDEPVADLGGKTPLEVARTPNLDHMASRGILGLTRTVPEGLAPDADVGALAVLGYDPAQYRIGRASLEAASIGVKLGPEDVAFRLNLVTFDVSEAGVEVMGDSAAGHLPTGEAAEIVADLGRALGRDGLEFHAGVSYRHLLVWRGGEARVRTRPPYALAGAPLAAALPEGPGADVLRDLMERARAVLAEHPLCRARLARGEAVPAGIWPWGQGTRAALPTLRERFGLEGSVVAGVDLANGLGVLAGLRRVAVPGAIGFLDTNFLGKAEAGLRALAERELLFLHVEAPDEAGHMGDARKKVEAIESFDAQTVGPLLDGLRAGADEWRVLATSAVATPCARRTHTADPVPFVVYVAADERKKRTVNRGYNERDARDQGIFMPEAYSLLARLARR